MPKIIPPSPTAAALTRYGEIPVDYSTGVPKIEIPIFTIKSGKLELPINISYHASGIKANDIATVVGLGWVLNAGGVVAGTTLGGNDGRVIKKYKQSSEITNAIQNATNESDKVTIASELDNQIKSYYDTQSDRYGYNFNNHAGVFRYNYLTDEQLLSVPYSPIIIKKKNVMQDQPPYFEITDENGNLYVFKDIETSISNSSEVNYSWSLSKIVSSDRTDSIQFYYRQDDHIYENYWSSVLDFGCSEEGSPCVNPPYSYSQNNNTVNHSTLILDSISCRTTIVHFDYKKDNLDYKRASRLTKISILNNARNAIKEIVFNQSSFGSGNGKRLRLDGVTFMGGTSTPAENYGFTYNTLDLPAYDVNTDYWGYNNTGYSIDGPPYLPLLIPKEFLNLIPSSVADLYGGNRNPNPYLMQACMLNEIHYPTGGKTVFEFEPNKASPDIYGYTNTNNGVVGGLRIKTMSNYTSTNVLANIKTYEYTIADINLAIGKSLFHQTKPYRFSYLYSDPYVMDSHEWEFNHDIYFSYPLFPLTTFSGITTTYAKVTEYLGTMTSNIGKTEYKYEWDKSLIYEDIPVNASAFQYDRGNCAPRLKSKIEYKNKNGLYNEVHSITNIYQYLKTNLFNTGVNLYHRINWIPVRDRSPYTPYAQVSEYLSDFEFSDTYAYQDVPMLIQTIDSTYMNEVPVVTATNYVYDNNIQCSKKTLNASNGDTLITEYKYPYNFNSTGNIYQTMTDKNILSPIVEQIDSKYNSSGTTFIQSTKNDYGYFQNNTIIAPSSVETKNGANNYESRINFNAYDPLGNLTDISKTNDIHTVYLWSYNYQYPIAKIEGLTYDEVCNIVGSSDITNLAQQTSPTRDAIEIVRTKINASGKAALVSTYTYSPIIGMTSFTDPRGIITYYTYDNLNRLSKVQDNKNNVVSNYLYMYK